MNAKLLKVAKCAAALRFDPDESREQANYHEFSAVNITERNSPDYSQTMSILTRLKGMAMSGNEPEGGLEGVIDQFLARAETLLETERFYSEIDELAEIEEKIKMLKNEIDTTIATEKTFDQMLQQLAQLWFDLLFRRFHILTESAISVSVIISKL